MHYVCTCLCTIFVGLSTGIRFLEIKQFIAKIGCQNTRSFELFKKLGFIEVCVLCMVLMYCSYYVLLYW